MKKYILSPLCSALVIPGLGQILNHHLAKGMIILSLVFVLFVSGTVKLALIIRSLVNQTTVAGYTKETLIQKVQEEDHTVLLFIAITFLILWVYSVIDAFCEGLKLERRGEGNNA